MSKLIKISILAVCLFILTGCGDNQKASVQIEQEDILFVSIPPQAGLLRELVEEEFKIQILVSPGQSPHSYEPTPKQLTSLSKAKAFMAIGISFEHNLLKKIESICPELKIIQTQNGCDFIQMNSDHHHCESCVHEHGANDPHVWLSTANIKTIAANMLDTLIKLDRDNETIYRQRFEQLEAKNDKLKTELDQKLAPIKGKGFYVFHPSFGYFAKEFGLKQIPIEVEGKSPSPRQLAEVIDTMNQTEVKTIFIQRQFPIESAHSIAKAINGKAVQLDPLEEDLLSNLQIIADELTKVYQ